MKHEECREWIFTFGYSHLYPNRYVKIRGTCGETREQMFSMFGPRWCFQYPISWLEKLKMHGITQLTWEELVDVDID